MAGPNTSKSNHSLSLRLLRVVLLSALVVGGLLSLLQIAYNAEKTVSAINEDGERLLAMFRDPSLQAIYNLDTEMGTQVVEGMFQHPAVRSAKIGDLGELVLAEKNRPLVQAPYRWATDFVLGQEKGFTTQLIGREPFDDHYGELSLVLDTADYGHDLVLNSAVIFVSGVLRALALALVLTLVYYWMLTKPLSKIIGDLSNIAVNHPGRYKLPKQPGHEHDELGRWIDTANQMLDSIEHHQRLHQEAQHNLQHLTQFDALTGLPNRQRLQSSLEQMLEGAGRLQSRLAILCVGVDDFKGINERYSYQVGDQLLVALSERLRRYGGRSGTIARLGGDQFVLVRADFDEPYQVAALAQNILDDLESTFPIDGFRVQLRATIGITMFPEDGKSTEVLLQKAEQTMTLAKSRSRNRYQFFVASIDNEIRHRRELDNDLRVALQRDEFFLVYQPQIDLKKYQVVGMEALIRWQHPAYGLVPPDVFIPLAEQNNCILAIGDWVLDQACRQLRAWCDLGYGNLRVAVNLSAVQLRRGDLPETVKNILRQHKLSPNQLELEVTETGLMEDIATAARHLNDLRDLGVGLAIDDFGTGYSSLTYLENLPLDKIKIDKSFVHDLLEDEGDATIVRAIIQLGASLNMQVIAEGVETVEQEAYILAQGCDEGQGYLYSKPLQPEDFLKFLREEQHISRFSLVQQG
ncbi:Putative diguanylate cyclase/phosphodiesterase (GGDEF & EAL domains) precursor [gamma proteobacterium HdN1]|nr:Putative diguanylate cyclase/phosphodiesterase (GGDEF & EAL domains) precursor [gamma proteobacterium HdN1]